MALPDTVTVAFKGKHTQFNGIQLDIVRKDNNVLLQFDGMAQYDDKQARQAVGLLDRLKQRSEFKVLEASDVPDPHYFAPDVTDKDRGSSIFLEPAAGQSPASAQYAVLEVMKLLRATPKMGNAGRGGRGV